MRVIVITVFLAATSGCAHQPVTRTLAFAGGQTDSKPDEQASAQAWVVSEPAQHTEWLDVRLTNHGSRRLEMGSVIDRFTAKTRDGRTVELEEGDFFHYPNALPPGQEVSVKLLLPTECPVYELEQITAMIDHERTSLTLVPIGPPVARPGPRLAGTGEPDLIREQAAYGAVLITVEFQQELGAVLTATVWWDDAQELVVFSSGKEDTFAIVPGRHELHVTSELAQLGKTEGHIPIRVNPEEQLRVTIDARATLNGPELRVRVWTRTALVSDELFQPAQAISPHA